MTPSRRNAPRGLTMPAGRRIPRPPDTPPSRPPPPDTSDADVPADVAKAAGELTALNARIRTCEACGRAGAARVYGTGYPRAAVMVVKGSPSPEEASSAHAFEAEAPALTKAFEALGIPVAWVYGSTAVRCGDAPPSAGELEACSRHLLVEVESIQPRVLVAFGDAAVEAVRSLDGRCGLGVPDDIPRGQPVGLRGDLVMIATEELPAGVTNRDAKRRLWRDLQAVPKLIGLG